ncbi:MAG TPA: CHAT domain-containing protein, partial [Longimicrobium sp.]|nr:CHAT domain-containing protein [Longimicrobium sp.]
GVAGALFELLLPNDLKDYEPDRNDMILVVDRTTARFPWELLRNTREGDDEPLSVRRGLIRQFSTRAFRPDVVTPPGNRVLVVGEPVAPSFGALPGAREEAEMVAALLTDSPRNFDVTSLINPGFERVVTALFNGSYRILHLAGHGVSDWVTPEEERLARKERRDPRTVSGMVLADDVFLEPRELDRMRNVPELAFVNCCFLGSIEPRLGRAPELAANVAEQLIRMGVKAVVAAGWAVEDRAAQTFARTFYGEMLAGSPFGRAVHVARRETFRQHPGTNTWGAYQCYGDHGYVLERAGDRAYAPPSELTFTCVNEVVFDLENLAGDADTTSQFGLEPLREQLREIRRAIPASWRGRAPLRAALARAYAQVGMLPQAIHQYRRLARADKASYTVEALEQLANLQSRWAVICWKRARAGGGDPDPARIIRRIEKVLEALEALPGKNTRSAERWSLIGSAHKRLSQLEPPAERPKRLRRMRDAYGRGHVVARERRGRLDPYPTRMWLAARVVAQYLGAGIGDARFVEWVERDLLPCTGE